MGSIRRVAAALLLLGACAAGWAQDANETEQKAAFEAARKVQVAGPGSVKLRDQAALALPAGYTFIPQAEAGRLLQSMGNRAGDNLVGVVFPTSEDGWFAVIRYIHDGHIQDDEARDWNADDLLKSLREGTEAANGDRAKRGIPGIEVTGWAEKPAYDAAAHRLVWSATSREKGTTGTQGLGVNYNTYALGREGYLSLNLVTDLDQLARYKPAALELLGATEFNEGRRYADFNGSTDKVAAYGLAALVAGAAAKKLGLFALLLAFAAKFAKVIVVAAGGAVYGVGKLLGWRKARTQGAAQGPDLAP
ncbi:MAG: DUF2167 domain-containing protein [Ramlibacter sp.]